MNIKKLNNLCDLAITRGKRLCMNAGFSLQSIKDKDKFHGLKVMIECINDLEKIKRQIECEIRTTKEMAKEELECSKNYILSTSEYIGESIKHALSMNSNAEMIKYIDAAIYGLNCLNENIGYLETLRERLSFEEEEGNEI